ncbi:MAG: hypothetical protein GTO03_03660 [Planctomycetales bacterium]|nr:hypothetical protein [Planctomycetales bacterium]
MLIPRFSIRRLLILIACCAPLFVMMAAAWRRELWAAGVVIALLFLVATLFVHAAAFGMAWLLYQLVWQTRVGGPPAGMRGDGRGPGAGTETAAAGEQREG